MIRPGTALVAALWLAACGGDGQPSAEVQRSDDPPARTAPAPDPAPGDAVRSSGKPVRTAGARPRVEVLARGLEVPWDVAFLPDGRALVTERPGRVRMLDEDGDLQRPVVARVATQARGEGGLLGIAVDPDFADGRRFVYLYVTTASGMQVQRWRLRGDRLPVSDDDDRILRVVPPAG